MVVVFLGPYKASATHRQNKDIQKIVFACDRADHVGLLVWNKKNNFATWWRYISGRKVAENANVIFFAYKQR